MITALALSPALDVTHRLDTVVIGEIHRPQTVLRLAGGKALNVARAATTLGAGARVVAPLGGYVGALIAELAERDGIDLDVVPVPTESRMCVSAVSASGEATEFYEPVPAIDEATWDALLARLAAAPADGWTVLSGRLPSGIPVDRLAVALRDRRSRGDAIAVDGSGEGLAELLAAVAPELVKVNRSEAAGLLGGDATSLGGLANGIRSMTNGTVVLTDGAHGAIAVSDAGSWRAASDPSPGRFAIGSGDSFLAGLLVALQGDLPLSAALLSASAAGSANTRVPGAGVFSPAEVAAASARIEVRAEPDEPY